MNSKISKTSDPHRLSLNLKVYGSYFVSEIQDCFEYILKKIFLKMYILKVRSLMFSDLRSVCVEVSSLQ